MSQPQANGTPNIVQLSSNGKKSEVLSADEMTAQANDLLLKASQKKFEAEQKMRIEFEKSRAEITKEFAVKKRQLEGVKRRLVFLQNARPNTPDEIDAIENDTKKTLEDLTKIEGWLAVNSHVLGIEETPSQPAKAKFFTPVQVFFAGMKIIVTIVTLYQLVIESGLYIDRIYPGAAVYNQVSFQKVLFAISVLFSGLAVGILALSLAVPSIAKYLNPFSHSPQSFSNEFSTLTAWQRSIVSQLVFCLFFLAFILLVMGKLD